jgi:Meiotically up-regulated gene 113
MGRPSVERTPKEEGFVYFIETTDGAFVKIGYSRAPQTRLSQLGTLRPGNFAIRIIGYLPGTRRTESWLHAKFAEDRDSGEWFRSNDQLRAFIAAVGLIEPRLIHPRPRKRRPPKVRIPLVVVDQHDAPVEAKVPGTTLPEKRDQNPAIGAEMVARRYAKMTPEERTAAARNAAQKRWAKEKAGGKGKKKAGK